MLVFLLESEGRTLARKTLTTFQNDFLEKNKVKDAKFAMGPSVNTPVVLADQIGLQEKKGKRWEIVYFCFGKMAYQLTATEKQEFLERIRQCSPRDKSHIICAELLYAAGRLAEIEDDMKELSKN